MSFAAILKDLVTRVPHARGAVFVDSEGEYVELFSTDGVDGEDDMKLAGAHEGIVLNMFAEAARNSDQGTPRELYVRNTDLDVFACMLKDGYFVLLTRAPRGIPGHALHELRRAARAIEAEI